MWLRCCGPDSLARVELEALRSLGIRFTIREDTATSYLEITVPFAPIFSRNNATKHTRSQCHSQRQANLDLFDETHRQWAQILEEL
jgi:hypothetical protein